MIDDHIEMPGQSGGNERRRLIAEIERLRAVLSMAELRIDRLITSHVPLPIPSEDIPAIVSRDPTVKAIREALGQSERP